MVASDLMLPPDFAWDLDYEGDKRWERIRLNHALQLLFQSELSISSIAVATGFQSLSSFSRSFKAEFGRSPRHLLATLRREGNAAIVPASQKGTKLKVG